MKKTRDFNIEVRRTPTGLLFVGGLLLLGVGFLMGRRVHAGAFDDTLVILGSAVLMILYDLAMTVIYVRATAKRRYHLIDSKGQVNNEMCTCSN